MKKDLISVISQPKKLAQWVSHPKKKQILSVVGIIVAVALVFLGLQAVRKAIKISRLTEAQLIVLPEDRTLSPGESQKIEFKVNTQGSPVDGVQLIGQIRGEIPENLAIQVEPVEGLTPLINSISGEGDVREFTLVLLTANPQIPYQSSQPILIGSLSFTAPESGKLNIELDKKLTKITAFGEAENVIKTPNKISFDFK